MQEQLEKNLRETITDGRLEATPLLLCPAISLYLISSDYPRGRLPEEEMQAIMARPAYWAFCWASGDVLARFLLDQPQYCKGKSVLDLGAGSGVVAIAAAMAGASEVVACDLDPHALEACHINSALNNVEVSCLDDLKKATKRYDLIIAADVLYDRENLEWLDRLHDFADEILIADSRIRDPDVFRDYEFLQKVEATTVPDLDELKEFGSVSIYHRR